MRRNFRRFRILPALAAGLLAAAPAARAVELYTSETEEPGERQPELVVGAGTYDFGSQTNPAAVQQSLGVEEGAAFAVERLYWENAADNDWRVYVDGRYLENPDAFAVTFEMHNGLNTYLDIGFRTWKEFDLPGELYYPPTDTFAVLSADALEEDINQVEISLTLMPRDTIKLILEYRFFEREGARLSTIYGDDFPYVVGGTPSRGIIPAVYEGFERVHTADISLIREDWIDRAGLRFHYQKRQVDRQHVVERAANVPSANRYTTQQVESEDDLFSLSGFNRTELGDSLIGSVGFVFTRLDGDLTGSRIFGANPEATYDIDFPATQLYDRGFLDLENTRRLKQWVFNANLVYTPSETYRWTTGVRLEHLATEAFSSYLDTYSTVDWSRPGFEDQEALTTAASEKSALDASAFLEGRYTGIQRLHLYSRVEVSSQGGDLEEDWNRQEVVPDAEAVEALLDRVTDFERVRAFWETGAHWFPAQRLRVSVEGYLKHAENRYDWGGAILPPDDYTLYPGYIRNQVFYTRDINARVRLRILPSLRSVSRIDFQNTSIESEGGGAPQIESSHRDRLVFNQSLVWTPWPRLFLSGSFNLVEDLTETGAAELEGTFGGIIVNLPQDYWQADANLYYVVSKLLDVQLSYQYLQLDGYKDPTPRTVAYGTELDQHHGMARLIFHLNEFTTARIAYHYYERDEPSTGGFTDYRVHLVSGSLQLVF